MTLRADHPVSPLEQLLAILPGHIDDAHEYFDRQVLGKLRDELAFTARAQLLDEADRECPRLALERGYTLGREGRIDQGAIGRMRGRVGENREQWYRPLAAHGDGQHAA